jgi:RES domain-containing protein
VVGTRIHWKEKAWSDTYGALHYGGRWNRIGIGVVYAAENYSLAVLETLVHAGRTTMPANKVATEILIPLGAGIETAETASWDVQVSQEFGRQWYMEQRTLVLRVPSAVVRGREFNLVINPEHPDFKKLVPSAPLPIEYDPRLFLTSTP